MNKEDYLRKLNIRLSVYSTPFRRSILNEIEDQFRKGEEMGLSDEEIIDRIGSIDEMLETIRMMNGDPGRAAGYANMDRKEDVSFGSVVDQVSSTLEKSFDTFVDIVGDRLNQSAGSVRNYYSESSLPEAEWKSMPKRQGITVASENSSVNVYISRADSFAYCFRPGKSILGKYAEMHTYDSDTEFGFALSEGTGRLDITVPDPLSSLKIDLSSGSIGISDLRSETVTCRTTSGKIGIQNMQGEELNFITVSGSFDGRILKGEDIRIMTTSGSVSLQVIDGDVTVKTASGNLNVFSQSQGKLFASITSGRINVTSSADVISLSTTSGSVTLDTDTPVPDITVETSSGDISCRMGNPDCRVAVRKRSGRIQNLSPVRLSRESFHEFAGGYGEGKILLITKSGNITLR